MARASFEIRVDPKGFLDVSRRFRRIARTQLPFAEAAGLTDTAKSAQAFVQKRMTRSFTVRNRGVTRAIAIEPAKKRDNPRRSLVGTRPWAEFLTLHTTGGVKRSKGGHRIAVPTRIVKRGATGRVLKRFKPRKLRKKKGFDPQQLEEKQRISVRTRRTRGASIFYNLRRRVKIKRTWPFADQVGREARRVYPKHFRRRLEHAVRTAR